jgi:hypothetical protein
MFMFAIETTSSEGVRSMRLMARDSEAVTELALSVCRRRGWQGPSVLSAVRLYRVALT